MKKLLPVIAIIVALAVWAMGVYNKFPRLDETVTQAWANVESDYQRRSDLIPNLVETVKGFASHEKEVFTEVTNARASVGQIKISPEMLNNPEMIKQFQENQGAIGSALSKLIAVSENYPVLKSDQNFLKLQDQLEGTENRISVSRKDFNKAVKAFNTARRSIPGKWIADAFFPDMELKVPFAAQAGAEIVPAINFN
jgi:LemA protein